MVIIFAGSRHWKDLLWIGWHSWRKWCYHCMPSASVQIIRWMFFFILISISTMYFRLKVKWTSWQWKKLASEIVSVFLTAHLHQSLQRSCHLWNRSFLCSTCWCYIYIYSNYWNFIIFHLHIVRVYCDLLCNSKIWCSCLNSNSVKLGHEVSVSVELQRWTKEGL